MSFEKPLDNQGGVEDDDLDLEQIVEMNKKFQEEAIKAKRENATELQREVAEQQAIRFEGVVLGLMRRSGDDPKLVNALLSLIEGLESKASIDNPEESFGGETREEITAYLEHVSTELLNDVVVRERDAKRVPTWKYERGK